MDKRRHPFPLILDSRARATSTRVNEIKREGGGGGEERERERERRLSFCISTLVRWKFRYGGDFLRGMASPVPALNLIGCRVISRCVTSGWLVAAVVMTTPHHHHHRGRHPRINRPPRPRTPALLCRVLVARMCAIPMSLCFYVFQFASRLRFNFSTFLFLFFPFVRLFPSFSLSSLPFLSPRCPSGGETFGVWIKQREIFAWKRDRFSKFCLRIETKIGWKFVWKLKWNFFKCTRKGFFFIFAISKDIHRHVKVYLHWNMNIHINI